MSEQGLDTVSPVVVSPDERAAIVEAISDTWFDDAGNLPLPDSRRGVFERVFSGGDRPARDEAVTLSAAEAAIARATIERWLATPYEQALRDAHDEHLRGVGRAMLTAL